MDNKTNGDNSSRSNGAPRKRLKQSSLEAFGVTAQPKLGESSACSALDKDSVDKESTETIETESDDVLMELKNISEATSKKSPHSEDTKDKQTRNDQVMTDASLSTPSTSKNSTPEKEEQSTNQLLKLGTPILELKLTPQCAEKLPDLSSHAHRTVLYKVTNCFATYPDPWPENYEDKWDVNHVQMPCSRNNLYLASEASDETSRWSVITSALSDTKIDSSIKLEEFSTLETITFFNEILPGIIQLALKLPKLCTKPIPLLKQNMNHTIFLSQMQIASLLANAFLCTFPKRNNPPKGTLYASYPNINFSGLFAYYRQKRLDAVIEKLKCLINYFRRVIAQDPCGTVSFTRQMITHFPSWKNCSEKLCKLHVTSQGIIEEAKGMLQVDFADTYLGGGVLKRGCVQEEIRFASCPEMIVGLLFTECLQDNESLIIKGVERYNKYTGYARTFKWDGDFVDSIPRDEWGRRYTTVVAIDATRFRRRAKSLQYTPKHLIREVNKAYCGFCSNTPSAHLEAVATGNWGCGIFGGDPRLKSLIQIIAASKAGRDLVYFTFKDSKLCKDIYDMHTFLTEKNVSIGDLWKLLELFSNCNEEQSLYDYLYETLGIYSCDTDSQEEV